MQLPEKLTDVTQQDLDNLIQDKVLEGPHLEFKRELPKQWNNEAKHEFVADMSAFANAGGGDVIYGLSEDVEGQASEITPLLELDIDATVRRLQSLLADSVEPRMHGMQVVPVKVMVGNVDGYVIVVRIPQSWVGPHRVKTNQHFYIREGNRKRSLDVPEIRSLFLRTENQAQRAWNFRTERVGKIFVGETPQSLIVGPSLVVHLIPTQAVLGQVEVDVSQYSAAPIRVPLLGPSESCAMHLNFDGALCVRVHRQEQEKGVWGYTQFFRNAFIESVYVLKPVEWRKQEGLPGPSVLPSAEFERWLIKLVKDAQVECGNLGIIAEMSVMLSLVRAKNLLFGVDSTQTLLSNDEGIFDRDTLIYPDVLVEVGAEPAKALKPLFDMVWQSVGIPWSPHYDQTTGARNPR